MTNKMTPTHWFRIAGAGGFLSVLYVGIVIGDALDGQITTVTPQINAMLVVWPAAAIATTVILAGVAKMIGRWVGTATAKLDAMGERIDRNAALLEQTREIPPPRIVGTAAVVDPDELDRYAEGLVDGLASRHPGRGTVVKIGDHKS